MKKYNESFFVDFKILTCVLKLPLFTDAAQLIEPAWSDSGDAKKLLLDELWVRGASASAD